MHSSQAAMKEMTGLQDTTELTKKFEFNPKDGIDNPALSLADDSGGGNIGGTPGRMVHRNLLVNAVPQLVKIQICALAEINEPEEESHVRYCFLKKEDGESFGFCLRQEAGSSGHIVRQVTSGGLAHRRGLRNGDRILEVNGVCVEGMEHLRVVWKIKSSGKQVLLTVLDGNAYDLATALHQDITQFLPPHSRPQLCRIVKDQSGFGFTVSAPEGTKGTFQLSVLRDGPAYKAGVPDRSWLLELNGASVANWTSAQLNKKLKHASSPMGLLVIDGESEEFYRQRGVKVTGAMADASHIPFEVRKLEMVRGPDGYGFLLKEEKRCFGRRGQFLREVDLGMPAEKAGMKDGDRLLAVNGESAEDLDHQEVVLRIRANSHWVTLLVIEAEGSKFFDLVGLSPLLFYDDQDPASVLHTTPTLPPSALKPCQCHLGGRGSSRENGLPLNQPGDGTRAFNTEETEELSQAF